MKRKRILVVDDELHITKILSFRLTKEGLAVITANDGETGFLLAREQKPDLIVTDFQMPNLNGYQLSVRLHDELITNKIPIIMLTARAHKMSPIELAKTNIMAVIPKPFSAREVLFKIQEMIKMMSNGEDTCSNHMSGITVV